jgi:hypothetical protein
MRTPIGVAVALAIAVAGCGGAGGDSGGLTRAQLDAKTTRICRHGTAQIDRLGTPDLKDPAATATWLEAVLRVADADIAQERALEPTAGLKRAYDAWVAQVVAERNFAQRVLAKARARDHTGLEDLQNEADHHTHDRAVAAAARRAGLTGCAKDATPTDDDHAIRMTYEAPQGADERLAQEVLQGGAGSVAKGFSQRFKLPADVTIAVKRGTAAPFYDPSDHTITWTYGFVDDMARILRGAHVVKSEYDFGEQLAAIASFITLHEIGHAFVDLYHLPIAGREEDAVDGLATVFLTGDVPGGARYTFYAARFLRLLQSVQGTPDLAQFQDQHSLSIQRSDDILCAIAGSSDENMRKVASFGVLSRQRLASCPDEYQSKVSAWRTLLAPHMRR